MEAQVWVRYSFTQTQARPSYSEWTTNSPVLLTYPVSSSRFGSPLLNTDNQVLSDKEKKASSYERNEEIQAIRRKYTPGEEKETFKKEKKIKTMKIKFVNRNRIL